MKAHGKALLLMLLAMAAAVWGTGETGRKARSANPPSPSATAAIAEQKAFGVKTAPIRIDEFSDFECPACRALYMQTLRPLVDDYVSSGKVYLVHHDFPLPMHPYSRQAAYYANAAAVLGRFEPVEQALFVNQPGWEAKGNITEYLARALSPKDLKRVEELAGTKAIASAIDADVALGRQLNVRETPTMFVTSHGQRVPSPIVGAVSYPILRTYLNALLRQ